MHPTTRPAPQDQRAAGCANTLRTCLTLALVVAASLVLAACTTFGALATQLGIAAPAMPTL